jgi:CBS domain-containing protein
MDVMTTDVITVDPETTVQALATLLAERGISGAPVVDASSRIRTLGPASGNAFRDCPV